VLDGQLLAEDQSEVNLAELLHIAREEFSDGNTIDEATLEVDWPKLRLQLGRAMQGWSTADVADTERITGALEITMTTSAPKPVEEPKPKKQPKQSTEPKAKKTKTKAEAAHADDSDDAFAGMALWVQAKRTK
jgi:hypothetical protein